jgi:hypothetical protein
MELAEIQGAIEELPKDQQAALASWLTERDQAAWDVEIERDFSPGGKVVREMLVPPGTHAEHLSSLSGPNREQ